jgi:hypothetical protein
MLAGVLLMLGAIFAKSKDLEKTRIYSADFFRTDHQFSIFYFFHSSETNFVVFNWISLDRFLCLYDIGK